MNVKGVPGGNNPHSCRKQTPKGCAHRSPSTREYELFKEFAEEGGRIRRAGGCGEMYVGRFCGPLPSNHFQRLFPSHTNTHTGVAAGLPLRWHSAGHHARLQAYG